MPTPFIPGRLAPPGTDIRIHAAEYDGVSPLDGLYVHFNLAVAGHAVGETYILSRIVLAGIDGAEGRPPVLDRTNCLVGRCVEFDAWLAYGQLQPEDFRGSMTHIKNTAELKACILSRYGRSRPHLTENEMVGMGVSRTVLEIIGSTDAQGYFLPLGQTEYA